MKFIPYLFVLTLMYSCAHHKDVRPGAEGIHSVSVQDGDTESGSRNAIAQANHFCEQRGKTAAFISEDKKYTGDMDEKTYKTMKRVGRVGQVVGSGVYALGDKKASALGGLGALGGTAAHAAAGDGYTVDMKFKCI
jgi:hypothetical protein